MSILRIDKSTATARLKCDGCGREFSVPFVSMGDKGIDAVFMRGLEAVSCDDCAERMRADERAREREERRRERLARIDELMEAAGIQPRFRRLSAEDAAPEVGEWILQGGNVMLSGESGSGKTTTVCRCLRRLIADGASVRYYPRFSVLAAEFAAMKKSDADDAPLRFVRKLNEYDVVAIDEMFDKAAITPMSRELVFVLLDGAYSEELSCRLWLVGNIVKGAIDLFGDGVVLRRRLRESFRCGIIRGGKVQEAKP